MKPQRFEVVVSGLASGEAGSLELELSRAAVRTTRRDGGTSVVIGSRRNAVFSVDDVLEVLAEWVERRPARLATTSIEVRPTRLPRPLPHHLLAAR